MKGCIIFAGESFRSGSQRTRVRGLEESYEGQILACKSHIEFIEKIEKKFNLEKLSVYISSYTTKYDDDLLKIYEKYLIGKKYYENPVGFNNLFHNSVKEIGCMDDYDFILVMRIDLCLEELFMNIFDPIWTNIRFLCSTWFRDCKVANHPRVNDMMVFIPKKYYKYSDYILNGDCSDWHHMWAELIYSTNLTYDDLDMMVNTYHDSDTEKDYNPYYYMVNRPRCAKWHSEGFIFRK